MINLRPIDDKFYLSGGWIDVPSDVKWLNLNHFRAILDLQFTPDDYSHKSHQFVKDTVENLSIKYLAVPMTDGENYDLKDLYTVTSNQLEFWDGEFTNRRDKILIKCGVGVSRSVSVLIDYYCKRDRLTYTEAKARISNVDRYNHGGLPISIDIVLAEHLKEQYPDISAFGVRNG